MDARDVILFFGGDDQASAVTLDTIDNRYSVLGLKRVVSGYSGALARIRRSSDNTEQDFSAGSDDWIDAAAISTFIGGGSGLFRTVYDQSGNTRHAVQTTAGNQPAIDLSGAHPTISFNGSSHYLSVASTAFAQNVPAVSLLAIRKHSVTTAGQNLLFASSNSTGFARAALGIATGPVHAAYGRRLDADSGVITTGFAANTDWGVQIGRFEYSAAKLYHHIDAQAEVKDPFQTAGNTSNTASASVLIGAATPTSGFFSGQVTLVALVQDLLTDSETSGLMSSLASLKAA